MSKTPFALTSASLVVVSFALLLATIPPLLVLDRRIAVAESQLDLLGTLADSADTLGAALQAINDTVQVIIDNTDVPPPASDVYTLDSNCDDNNECTGDYLVAPRYTCANEALSVVTSCSGTACFRSTTGTHCEPGTRTCVSSALVDCHGYWKDQSNVVACASAFAFNLSIPLIQYADTNMDFWPTFWFGQVVRFRNFCEAYAVILDTLPDDFPSARYASGGANAFAPPEPLALSVPDCRSFLDPVIYNRSKECIIADHYSIGANVTRALVMSYLDAIGYSFLAGPPSTGSFYNSAIVNSYQFGICVYRYACAEYDPAFFLPNFTSVGTSQAQDDDDPMAGTGDIQWNPSIKTVLDAAADRAGQKRATMSAAAAMSLLAKDVHVALLDAQGSNAATLLRAMDDLRLPADDRGAYVQHVAERVARALVSDERLVSLLQDRVY